jgi:hypothetical protein
MTVPITIRVDATGSPREAESHFLYKCQESFVSRRMTPLELSDGRAGSVYL